MEKPFSECRCVLHEWMPGFNTYIYNWSTFVSNPSPAAIDHVKDKLSRNEGLFPYEWARLSQNTNTAAIRLLQAYPKNIDYMELMANSNPVAVKMLQARAFGWRYPILRFQIWWHKNRGELTTPRQKLSQNQHPVVLRWLRRHPSMIDFDELAQNPAAEARQMERDLGPAKSPKDKFCEQLRYQIYASDAEMDQIVAQLDKLPSWIWKARKALCLNPQPWVADFLRKYPRHASSDLSANVSEWAMDLLRDPCNSSHLVWATLAANPAIFRDEYHDVARKYFHGPITEELMARVWHPRHINKFAALLGEANLLDS